MGSSLQSHRQYKISEGSLGKKVTQLGTTASAKQLLDDIETLQRAGADMGGILVGMREEIAAVVLEGVRLGTAIPENLRPYVEELARSGQLLSAEREMVT